MKCHFMKSFKGAFFGRFGGFKGGGFGPKMRSAKAPDMNDHHFLRDDSVAVAGGYTDVGSILFMDVGHLVPRVRCFLAVEHHACQLNFCPKLLRFHP